MDCGQGLAAGANRRGIGVTPERWQRVKEVFQSALERPPEDREAYLADETAGDPELQREVAKMLRHATGTGLLDRPAWLQAESGLDPGALLGPYEILKEVGAGGMGRVYQALDTRLGRTVAVKVLSAEFSHRLAIEGRAISALNHPHICALYDIGNQEGSAYLVMEYIDGESLAARLARGPLPLVSVLQYGAEVASALAAAHARGIVHRDLKPANIMVTVSGVKVLDFGVAKTAQDDETPGGALAGTAAYMSPSQLNGNPADARSDIFALGLVLFEMVTGRRRSSQEPDVPANVHAGLANLIEHCLRQDAGRRMQSMAEVQFELERLRSEHPRTNVRRWTKPVRIAVMLALAIAAAALTSTLTRRDLRQTALSAATERRATEERRPTSATGPIPQPATVASPSPRATSSAPPVRPARFVPPSLSTLTSYPGLERDPSFSPDGTNVAFSWHNGARGGYGIYVRPVKGTAPPRCLTDGTFEDWGPAWSPDGQTIAFRRKAAQPGIYLVSASGGPANLLASISHLGQETLPQMSWSHDGKWIAAPDRDSFGVTQIYLFAVDSGERRALTADPSGTDHAPAFSPDGKSLAYASCLGSVYPCDIYVLELTRNLALKSRRRITDQGVYVRGIAWLPDSRSLVYSAGRTRSSDTFLWRISLDATQAAERIDMAGERARHPAIATNGGLLAYTTLNGWNLMMIRNFR